MCPCHQNDSQFTVALLTAAGILAAVGIVRRFWPTMTRGLRILVVAGLVSLACVAFAFNRFGDRPDTCPGLPPEAAATQTAEAAEQRGTTDPRHSPATRAEEKVSTQPTGSKVVAYYFHRTIRCPSCLALEALAKQAIEAGFAAELAGGLLEWRSVNIEEKGHEHFERDLNLTAQSLVLVRMENGRRTNWKNLEAVWDHLGDPAALEQYVRNELQLFLYKDVAREP